MPSYRHSLESLGGSIALEEVCHWVTGFENLKHCTIFSSFSLFHACWRRCELLASFSCCCAHCLLPHLSDVMDSYSSENISQDKLFFHKSHFVLFWFFVFETRSVYIALAVLWLIDWPQYQRDVPTSPSQQLGLKSYVTIPDTTQVIFYGILP